MKSKNSDMHVVYAADIKYFTYAATSMLSIIANTSRRVCFHILHSGLPEEYKSVMNTILDPSCGKCILHKVSTEKFYPLKEVITNPNIRIESFYRLLIPSIIPQVDRALYLDCDTLAVSDIEEIYDTELDDAYLGAVEDGDIYQEQYDKAYQLNGSLYFCSGMMLMNLAKLRELDLLDMAIKNASAVRSLAIVNGLQFYEDQCILNYLLKSRTRRLPRRFHLMLLSSYAKSPSWHGGVATLDEYAEILRSPVIVHFTGLGIRMIENGLIPDFPYVKVLRQYMNKLPSSLISPANDDNDIAMDKYVYDWLPYFKDIASMEKFAKCFSYPNKQCPLALYGSSEYAFNCIAYLYLHEIRIEAVFDENPEFTEIFQYRVQKPKAGYFVLSLKKGKGDCYILKEAEQESICG